MQRNNIKGKAGSIGKVFVLIVLVLSLLALMAFAYLYYLKPEINDFFKFEVASPQVEAKRDEAVTAAAPKSDTAEDKFIMEMSNRFHVAALAYRILKGFDEGSSYHKPLEEIREFLPPALYHTLEDALVNTTIDYNAYLSKLEAKPGGNENSWDKLVFIKIRPLEQVKLEEQKNKLVEPVILALKQHNDYLIGKLLAEYDSTEQELQNLKVLVERRQVAREALNKLIDDNLGGDD
jgi:hypothetical protein